MIFTSGESTKKNISGYLNIGHYACTRAKFAVIV